MQEFTITLQRTVCQDAVTIIEAETEALAVQEAKADTSLDWADTSVLEGPAVKAMTARDTIHPSLEETAAAQPKPAPEKVADTKEPTKAKPKTEPAPTFKDRLSGSFNKKK